MQNTNPIKTASITIPAGGGAGNPGSIQSNIGGQLFACYSATAPFRMQFDSGGVFDCIAGAVIPAGSFNGLTFYNESANPIIVVFAVGVLGISFIPTNTFKAAPTYTKGTDGALAAGATLTFSGLDGINNRKQITVQNCDAGGNTLVVQDGNANAMALITAGSPPWTLETTGVVKVKNPNGTGLSRVIVGETFFS